MVCILLYVCFCKYIINMLIIYILYFYVNVYILCIFNRLYGGVCFMYVYSCYIMYVYVLYFVLVELVVKIFEN